MWHVLSRKMVIKEEFLSNEKFPIALFARFLSHHSQKIVCIVSHVLCVLRDEEENVYAWEILKFRETMNVSNYTSHWLRIRIDEKREFNLWKCSWRNRWTRLAGTFFYFISIKRSKKTCTFAKIFSSGWKKNISMLPSIEKYKHIEMHPATRSRKTSLNALVNNLESISLFFLLLRALREALSALLVLLFLGAVEAFSTSSANPFNLRVRVFFSMEIFYSAEAWVCALSQSRWLEGINM